MNRSLHLQNAEILDSAAYRIEQEGWYRGTWGNSGGEPYSERGISGTYGGTCAGLMIDRIALERHVSEFPVYRALGRHLRLVYVSHSVIYTWNDRQPDSATVIAVLRAAAEHERKKSRRRFFGKRNKKKHLLTPSLPARLGHLDPYLPQPVEDKEPVTVT